MNSLYTIIGNQLSTPRNLNDDMRLIEDLGMDSLALMNLVLDIEDEFGISFDDVNLLFENFNRIGDLRDIIEKLESEKNNE